MNDLFSFSVGYSAGMDQKAEDIWVSPSMKPLLKETYLAGLANKRLMEVESSLGSAKMKEYVFVFDFYYAKKPVIFHTYKYALEELYSRRKKEVEAYKEKLTAVEKNLFDARMIGAFGKGEIYDIWANGSFEFVAQSSFVRGKNLGPISFMNSILSDLNGYGGEPPGPWRNSRVLPSEINFSRMKAKELKDLLGSYEFDTWRNTAIGNLVKKHYVKRK